MAGLSSKRNPGNLGLNCSAPFSQGTGRLRSGMVDRPVNFLHTDAQKSDNISIIVFYTSSHPGCGPIPSQDASIQVRPTCRSHSLWKFLSIGPKFSSDMLKLGQIKPKSYIVGLYEFMKQFWIRYGNNPIDALGLTMILVMAPAKKAFRYTCSPNYSRWLYGPQELMELG